MGSAANQSQLNRPFDNTTALQGLGSSKGSQRLQEIACLRDRGVGECISLPQLVVCGDQSAGKSSVLEGITGLPFPRKDGVCTRFATEIILMHTEDSIQMVAQIVPSPLRSEKDRMGLATYRRDILDFGELPQIMAEAGALMGVRGFGDSAVGPAFARDILRVTVCGRTGLHLSVVDLPGLIAVANEEQTEADVQAVHDLVNSYVQNSRTIILAVVQANNDIANQGIVQKSKKFDKDGERTIGIITKPDLLNAGTEHRVAALAKNQDTTRLKLGFFLLKNPSPSDLASGYRSGDRERDEQAYFAASPWKEQGLEADRTGIAPLRDFLQRLLDRHLEKELPKVREEIRALIRKTGEDLAKLGDARPTPSHLRIFLSKLAMQFHSLTAAALRGDYQDVGAPFFDNPDDSSDHPRFRAMVHNMNTAFANEMREYGQTMIVAPDLHSDSEASASDSGSEDSPNEPQRVSQDQMKAFVMKLYRETRGRELPGTYNHVLLAKLFHHQSRRWNKIASDHLACIFDRVKLFVRDAVRYIGTDEHVSNEILDRIAVVLEDTKQEADEELKKLFADRSQPPVTYNHYYTDNVQNSRREETRKWIKQAMEDASISVYNGKLHISNTTTDAEKLLNALQRQVSVDMDDQACSEVLAAFSAYYKVARKTFVDNVCIQVIERHLLRGLPDLFSPDMVAAYADEELQRIAGESDDKTARRKQLQDLHDNLAAALHDLRK